MTLSVMYITPNDERRERFGFKNEAEARKTAYGMVSDGYRSVVLRCTENEGIVTRTIWAEVIGDDTDDPDTLKAEIQERDEKIHTLQQEADIAGTARYCVRELLADIQRTIMRGQQLSADWIEREVLDISIALNA